MKFMLAMHTPRDGYAQYMKWPRKILEANAAFMQAFTQRLREAGELVDAAALVSADQAVRVRADADGTPITDGVFPESKEFLAGWWIVDVESRERALQIAGDAARAPGLPATRADGTLIEHLWIEVRQILGGRGEIG